MGWRKILESIIKDKIESAIDEVVEYMKARIDEMVDRVEAAAISRILKHLGEDED